MKISLKQLDQGFPALTRLAQREYPRDQHKLAYKISRIYRSCKDEVAELQTSLAMLAKTSGLIMGVDWPFQDQVKVVEFRESERVFLKTTEIEIWGDPFHYSEIAEYVSTPMDLADLDWMILGGPEDSAGLEKLLTGQS